MTARGSTIAAAVAMLAVLGLHFATARHLELLSRIAPLAVLNAQGTRPLTPQFAVSEADARAAVRADPLNQRSINIAMLATVRTRQRAPDTAWFTALARLGWRDTASRQNLAIHHGLSNDGPALLDDVDAFLRRNQLIDELSTVLVAMEGDPEWRLRVAQRLRRHPPWRFGFLQRGSLIDDPRQLIARAHTVMTLQRSGDSVTASEVAPMLPKLLAAGLGRQAFAIWRALEPAIARPIADPSFADLAAAAEPSTVPFHWQLTNGPDYAVDAIARPRPHLSITWNGAGAPVFALQYLSASAGRYAVVLTSPDRSPDLPNLVGVRAICGATAVIFTHTVRQSPLRLAYVADTPVPCSFPRFELFGRSGTDSLRDRQATISAIEIASSI